MYFTPGSTRDEIDIVMKSSKENAVYKQQQLIIEFCL
jgi:hypothetical protein